MTDPDRRFAFASLAGMAIAGSAIALAGCRRDGDKEKSGYEGGEVTANEDLMREHGILRRILIAYREVAPKLVANAAAVDAAALGAAATLFRDFGERYHEQLLEEQHIFPIVRKPAAKERASSTRSSPSMLEVGRSPLTSSTGRSPVGSGPPMPSRWPGR